MQLLVFDAASTQSSEAQRLGSLLEQSPGRRRISAKPPRIYKIHGRRGDGPVSCFHSRYVKDAVVLIKLRWHWTLKALGTAFQRIHSAKRSFSMLEDQS
jgi:hypothetical protein